MGNGNGHKREPFHLFTHQTLDFVQFASALVFRTVAGEALQEFTPLREGGSVVRTGKKEAKTYALLLALPLAPCVA